MNPAMMGPPQMGLAHVPTYHDLTRSIALRDDFIYKLRKTIETLGRELNTVRRMNHHLAGQPPPPEIDYTPPIPNFT